jgi:hypothetical protein
LALNDRNRSLIDEHNKDQHGSGGRPTRFRRLLRRSDAEEADGDRRRADEDDRGRGRCAFFRAISRSRRSASQLHRIVDNHHTRLEHFQNVGRGTPTAALQTLVWSAIKGDDAMLAELLVASGPAREKANALLQRLPVDSRKNFPTPESLAALAVTGEILKGGVLEILGQNLLDPSRAIVTVRTNDEGKTAKLSMQLGPAGWQFEIPEAAIDAIERRMREQNVEASVTQGN